MKNRKFNSLMHVFNEKWAAEVLSMNLNQHKGADLIDNNKVVETKFKVIYPDKYMHISWRVLEHQMNYNNNKEAYWALGTYLITKPISEIKFNEKDNLEMFVENRELFIVCWDWMNQFPAYRQTGKTKISEWDNTIRFPKGRLLPKTIESYSVQKGSVYLTEGINTKDFKINGERI